MSKLRIYIESMNTGEYNKTSSSMKINYGLHPSVFGNCLIGVIDDKICYLAFPKENAEGLKELQAAWPNSDLIENHAGTSRIMKKLFDKDHLDEISLLLKGTPFQISVWQALAQVPVGSKTSYESIAQKVGNAKAVRAAASAIANNNIAFLIPCHRVIKKSGEIHKYRWGADLKRQLLEWEGAIA